MSDKPNLTALVPNIGALAVVLALAAAWMGGKPSSSGDKKPSPDLGLDDRADGPDKPAAGGKPPPGQPPAGPANPGHIDYLLQKKMLSDPDAAAALGGGTAVPACRRQTCGRVLIVTLPDPNDSQFGFWFDQGVEAVCRVGIDGDFVLESYWYPWETRRDKRSKAARGPDGDPTKDPGVLVFRHSNDPSRRGIVLLVGENPVSGAHPAALRAAFDLAAAGRPAGRVRLIAPFFTGGQPSVNKAIREWARDNGPVPFRVCSGTALGLTGYEPKDKEADHPGWRSVDEFRPAADVRVSTTQAPVGVLVDAALHYLAAPGRAAPADRLSSQDRSPHGDDTPRKPPDMSRVAFLIESNSGFGAASTRLVEKKNAKDEEEEAGETGQDRGSGPPEKERSGKAWVMRFPMHVSKLTGLLSRDRRERDEKLGLVPPGGFKLSFVDEARSGSDLLPSADEARTALINQRLLDDYWSVLRRQRVRYVGILATDPRDKIFLIEQLRRACPNAQPFTTGAELHYVHPEYLEAMRGTVIASTYPLTPATQQWAKPRAHSDPRRAPFPSCNAEGIYNAVLASSAMEARESGDPGKAADREARMLDYLPPQGDPDAAGVSRPPVWVTAVGEDGRFVPLAYFYKYDAPILHHQGGTADPPHDPAGEHQPARFYTPPQFGPLRVALAVLLAAALAAIVLVRWAPTPPAGVPDAGLIPATRGQYATLVGIGVLCAGLPFGLYFLSMMIHGQHIEWLRGREYALDGLLLLAVVLVSLAHVGLGARYLCLQAGAIWRPPPGDTDLAARRLYPMAPRFLSVAAVVVAGGLIAWVLSAHARAPLPGHLLFVERAAGLTSGYSVVVPAVAMALGLCGYGALGLKMLRVRTDRHVPCPYPDGTAAGRPNDPAARVHEAFRRVHELAAETDAQTASLARLLLDRRRGPQFLAVAAAVAGLAAAVMLRARATWEGAAWDGLFAAGFAALTLLAALSAFRLYVLWRGVQAMLRTVATIPMVRAFDRLPTKVAWVFSRYLVGGRWRTADLAIPLHLLSQIRSRMGKDVRTEREAARLKRDRVFRRLRAIQFPLAPAVVVTAGPADGTKAGNGAAAAAVPLPARAAAAAAAAEPALAGPDPETPELTGARVGPLSEAAADLAERLVPEWEGRALADAFGGANGKPDETEPAGWQGLAEQFIAIQLMLFLSRYFAQMRYLAYMTALAAAAVLVAATDYAFQPERLIMYAAAGLAVGVVCLIGWLLYQINRNEIVSRVTHTTPDRFSLDSAFVRNFVFFVLPLFAVVLIQVFGRMRSVMEPVLQVLR
jgi:hypothetical protein